MPFCCPASWTVDASLAETGGAIDFHMIAFCLFFAVLYKWTIPEELCWRILAWKIAFIGTQSKKRTTHTSKCTDFFMFMQVFRLFWGFLCCRQKKIYVDAIISWLSVYCVRNVVELSYTESILSSFNLSFYRSLFFFPKAKYNYRYHSDTF